MATLRSLVASDLLTTTFLGPWMAPSAATARRLAGPGQRQQQVFLSLAHWYHAAKFMPAHPDLRDAVVNCPTLREANKLAMRHKEKWRGDWQMLRHNVLVCGMGLLHLQRPEMQLGTAAAQEIAAGLSALRFPKAFVQDCLSKFDTWRKSPRIAVFGADRAPEQIVGTRIAKLVNPLPTWTLLIPGGRKTPWRLHDWALYHYVPVLYFSDARGRHTRESVRAMVDAADQVIVFEARMDKRHDQVIALAKASKRKLTLELYDREGAASQLSL